MAPNGARVLAEYETIGPEMASRGGQRSLRAAAAAAALLAALVLSPAALEAQGPDDGDATGPDAGAVPPADAADRSTRSDKESESVSIRDFSFAPKTVNIDAGERVRWENDGNEQHNATGKGSSFDTRDLDPGEEAEERFSDAGTYRYVCTIHPQMKGTVEVEAAGGGTGGSGGASSTGTEVVPAPLSSGPGAQSGFSRGSGDSRGSLPATGNEELPLFAVGAALVAAGLLAGAAAAWAEWPR
jgi:plastocyanin